MINELVVIASSNTPCVGRKMKRNFVIIGLFHVCVLIIFCLFLYFVRVFF